MFNKLFTLALISFFLLFNTANAQYVIERIDINPGPGHSDVRLHTPIDSFIYFQATDGTHGYELWRSDGTQSGTKMIKDIHTGIGNSMPKNFIKFDGKVYFAADDNLNGEELWVTDGTANGTKMVKDINPNGASEPQRFFVDGNKLFFAADDGTHGEELWVTDGTTNGTKLLKDIRGGNKDSYPGKFGKINGVILFYAYNGSTKGAVWTTDGTATGTKILTTLGGDAEPDFLNSVFLNNKMYFSVRGYNPPIYGSLWETDGTATGTKMVRQIDPFPPGNIESHYGVVKLKNNKFYFIADSSGKPIYHASELWVSDGTVTGTHRFTSIAPSMPASGPAGGVDQEYIVSVNDSLLYFVASDSVHGPELWVTDGTLNNTHMVKDIRTIGVSNGSSPTRIIEYANRCFFAAREDPFLNKRYDEFYVTDGTDTGTKKILAHAPGISGMSQNLYRPVVAGGRLFTLGFFDTTGWELWVITDTAYRNSLKDTATPPPGGVALLSQQAGFKVSPNPAHDKVLVSFDKTYNNGVITVTDVSGRLVKKLTIEHATKSMNINLSDVPKGVYVISLKHETGNTSKKILLE